MRRRAAHTHEYNFILELINVLIFESERFIAIQDQFVNRKQRKQTFNTKYNTSHTHARVPRSLICFV